MCLGFPVTGSIVMDGSLQSYVSCKIVGGTVVFETPKAHMGTLAHQCHLSYSTFSSLTRPHNLCHGVEVLLAVVLSALASCHKRPGHARLVAKEARKDRQRRKTRQRSNTRIVAVVVVVDACGCSRRGKSLGSGASRQGKEEPAAGGRRGSEPCRQCRGRERVRRSGSGPRARGACTARSR